MVMRDQDEDAEAPPLQRYDGREPDGHATPATTAMTRSSPLASSDSGVTCTTSIAVSGASSGWAPGKNSVATR